MRARVTISAPVIVPATYSAESVLLAGESCRPSRAAFCSRSTAPRARAAASCRGLNSLTIRSIRNVGAGNRLTYPRRVPSPTARHPILILLPLVGTRAFSSSRPLPSRSGQIVVVTEVLENLEGGFEIAAPRFDAFPQGEHRDDQRGHGVGPGPSEQAVQQEAEEHCSGEVDAQQELLGVGLYAARSE